MFTPVQSMVSTWRISHAIVARDVAFRFDILPLQITRVQVCSPDPRLAFCKTHSLSNAVSKGRDVERGFLLHAAQHFPPSSRIKGLGNRSYAFGWLYPSV